MPYSQWLPSLGGKKESIAGFSKPSSVGFRFSVFLCNPNVETFGFQVNVFLRNPNVEIQNALVRI